MEPISVFDMLKIGVGPSSSHTLGPWRAAASFSHDLKVKHLLAVTRFVAIQLYGSLALTGKGHGTDVAIQLGLCGEDPENIPLVKVEQLPQSILQEKLLPLGGGHPISFNPLSDIVYHYSETLPFHANGMVFQAFDENKNLLYESVIYSIGGGFIIKQGENNRNVLSPPPYPINHGKDLLDHCKTSGLNIAGVVWQNECSWRPAGEINARLLAIWSVMKQCIYKGCSTEGFLPGGLKVSRRAATILKKIFPEWVQENPTDWIESIKQKQVDFSKVLKLVGCFAMAVNEENASFGRIVTAPTNGSAGVIPAVLCYLLCFSGKETSDKDIIDFLMVAGEIGSIIKKGSTISAAMGGCQAEIGVSSAMAAAALTEALGGNPGQALMAAEIAMEHHLGLTCDPVGGLVQVPCIERNSMGAIKAITAAHIALESDPELAKISLDNVIKTMWETAQDMNSKYKETSLGGLATKIVVASPEC